MKNIFLTLFLFFAVSVMAQDQDNELSVKISGNLFSKYNKIFIANADVFFISKEKYIKTVTDKKGYFELHVPRQYIKDSNLLYFNFDKLNSEPKPQKKVLEITDMLGADQYGYRYIVFSKNENMINKEYIINQGGGRGCGARLVISKDFYCFNGKSINERKFDRLRKRNPNYVHFSLSSRIAKIASDINDIDYCYLLFSE